MQMKIPKNSTATSMIAAKLKSFIFRVCRAEPQRCGGIASAPLRADTATDANRFPATACWIQNATANTIASSNGPFRQSGKSQPMHAGFISGDVAFLFARIKIEVIPDPINGKQAAVDKQPFFPQLRGPQKRHALQITEKQRWIAQRQQAAAAVADDEDENHHGVGDVLPLAVGFQQRPNQHHRGARGADQAGQHRPPIGQECRIRRGMGRQIAFDPNAAADGVQAQQQHDERHVFVQQGVGQQIADRAQVYRFAFRRNRHVLSRKMPDDREMMGQGVIRHRQRRHPGGT